LLKRKGTEKTKKNKNGKCFWIEGDNLVSFKRKRVSQKQNKMLLMLCYICAVKLNYSIIVINLFVITLLSRK